MNKKEFAELTQEMADICFAYERFCKDGVQFDLRYTYCFYDELRELSKLDFENTFITRSMKYLSENAPKAKIEELAKQSKTEYNKVKLSLSNKYKKAQTVIPATDSLSDEDKKDLDAAFKAFIDKHHPAILYRVLNEEAMSYDNLKQFYYENNISGFQAYLDLSKTNFHEQNIIPEQYTDVAKYFYALQNQIKNEINTKGRAYPYIKHKVFDDEITIESERGDLRATIGKFRELNKNLHKDFANLYGSDINFE